MLGAARLRSKHSDTFSVLDNYGLPPRRIIVRFGDDGEGWRNMESASLRCESTRALRLVKTSAFSAAMRQTSPQLIDCACLPIGYANGEMSAIFPCQIVRTTLPNGPQKRLPVEQAAT